MKKRETRHIPVLLAEVLRTLSLRPGQILVDCTLGLAGHAAEILKRLGPPDAGGKLIGIDLDPHNLALAQATLAKISRNFSLHHTNFAGIAKVLAAENISHPPRVNGLLADIGVASTQIDDPARGFSYKKPGPLDMRMDPTRGRPAADLLATLSEEELTDALLDFGDETDAPKIALGIITYRKHTPIVTTEQLTKIVCEARDFTLQRALGAKLHPAARTFQALRILTNREMANLDHLLRLLPTILAPNGIVAIISFHSGEDRRVKQSFRDNHRRGLYSEVSDDPITATEKEVLANPRSRSAKLRWARRAATT